MSKLKTGNRGVLLIMVLATILVVTILANIALNIILSQARLTHHQVSRTQAYYAALAGVNYAIEKLRVNDADWPATGSYIRNLCRSAGSPCTGAGDIVDGDMPVSLKNVEITVGAPGSGINGTRKITAKAIYTPPVS